MKFRLHKKTRSKHPIVRILLATLLLLMIGVAVATFILYRTYQGNLRPRTSEQTTIVVTIEPGTGNAAIGELLHKKAVIKSDWAFVWYLKGNEAQDQLKAGTYVLSSSQSVAEIVKILVAGKVATDQVTILPGQRIDEIQAALIKSGFRAEDVVAALEPTQYKDHPALSEKPPAAGLDGYLYPETFQKVAETTAADIVRLSLNEMDSHLTPEIRQAIKARGLSVHQGVILASVVDGEVSTLEDRAKVAQVFYKRLGSSIKLESNASDEYAKLNPAYDTYKIDGLPPGPLSNVTKTSLQAVANPASTDWLFFVSGDDGTTHFSMTVSEHEDLIRKYCTKLCQ